MTLMSENRGDNKLYGIEELDMQINEIKIH